MRLHATVLGIFIFSGKSGVYGDKRHPRAASQ